MLSCHETNVAMKCNGNNKQQQEQQQQKMWFNSEIGYDLDMFQI